MALIEKAAVEQVLETPPDTLHITLMVRHIGVVQIDPKPKPIRQLLPLTHVPPDTLLTLVNERFDPERFNLFLGMDPQFLADLNLDR